MYPEIKTILYATDMGEHMRPVFRFALGMAKKHNATITMLHVAEPLSSGVRFAIDVYMSDVSVKKVLQEGMTTALKKMQQRLDQFCEEELKQSPEDRELVGNVEVISGRPAETITLQAQQRSADLIIVGSHSDTSFGANLLGSTARKVTQLSTIPVLVIPVAE